MTEFTPDPIEAAWAAGFFDGEGCFITQKTNGRTDKKYANINISQADPEVLHRFKKAVGDVGSVTGPYSKPDINHKDMWYYQCGSAHEVKQICDILEPYLSSLKLADMQILLGRIQNIRRYKKRSSSQEVENILDDYRCGMSYQNIADKYSRSYDSTVKLISSNRGKL